MKPLKRFNFNIKEKETNINCYLTNDISGKILGLKSIKEKPKIINLHTHAFNLLTPQPKAWAIYLLN